MKCSQWQAYARLMRWHKPVGILLLLWPTWWALCLSAKAWPPLPIGIIFTLGVVLMRSAGCVINDLMDREFDGQVARTRDRPLAKGEISVFQAWVLLTILCTLSLILVLFLNIKVFFWACLALSISVIYPLTKRFFPIPQLILGLGWYLAIPMAFAAQGSVNAITLYLYLAAVAWTIAYDTWYAMVDRADDLKLGLKSSAIFFGRYDRLAVAIFQSMAVLAWGYVGILAELKWPYFLALAGAGILFIYQQIIAYRSEPAQCFRAFLNNQWLGGILLLGILLGIF